ncbi:MAG TPA: rod shape-determining protein MreD [Clostridiales bacterium]|nr:rod shape-determining protein MreD [Clostridiales bacterium]
MKGVWIAVFTCMILLLVQSAFPAALLTGLPKPDLLLVFVILMAAMTDEVTGAALGLLVGLASDFLNGSAIGLSGVIYLYAGLLCGLISTKVYDRHILVRLLLCFYITLGAEILRFGFHALTGNPYQFLDAFRQIIFPESLLNVVAALLLYPVLAGRVGLARMKRW